MLEWVCPALHHKQPLTLPVERAYRPAERGRTCGRKLTESACAWTCGSAPAPASSQGGLAAVGVAGTVTRTASLHPGANALPNLYRQADGNTERSTSFGSLDPRSSLPYRALKVGRPHDEVSAAAEHDAVRGALVQQQKLACSSARGRNVFTFTAQQHGTLQKQCKVQSGAALRGKQAGAPCLHPDKPTVAHDCVVCMNHVKGGGHCGLQVSRKCAIACK